MEPPALPDVVRRSEDAAEARTIRLGRAAVKPKVPGSSVSSAVVSQAPTDQTSRVRGMVTASESIVRKRNPEHVDRPDWGSHPNRSHRGWWPIELAPSFFEAPRGGRPEARFGDIAPAAVHRVPGNCPQFVRWRRPRDYRVVPSWATLGMHRRQSHYSTVLFLGEQPSRTRRFIKKRRDFLTFRERTFYGVAS